MHIAWDPTISYGTILTGLGMAGGFAYWCYKMQRSFDTASQQLAAGFARNEAEHATIGGKVDAIDGTVKRNTGIIEHHAELLSAHGSAIAAVRETCRAHNPDGDT